MNYLNFDRAPGGFDMRIETITTAMCVGCDWEAPALHADHALALWEDHECEPNGQDA